jgi:NAD(P)-dependent dehydrogenase (short-subunit alcohol dehydrogenase family)
MDKDKSSGRKIAVVTGCSTGIGLETSQLLAKAGFHTYATVRNVNTAEALRNVSDKGDLPIHVIELDVNGDKSVKDAIDKIMRESKRIDVVVNNAGYGQEGALEDLSMDEIKAQFETNLFGAIRVMKAVLPIMRKQGGGTIINISSVLGRVAFPLFSAYHATKFALEGLSESMRYESEPFGIQVILVEPLAVKSNFFSNLKVGQMATESSSPYESMVQAMHNAWDHVSDQATPPEEVAKVVLRAVTDKIPSMRYMVGRDAIQMIEEKKRMSDLEFEGLIKQQFLAH